jgi:serine protease
MGAFLYRLAGEPHLTVASTRTFLDVASANPFVAEIEWMAAVGITTGTPGPGGPRYHPSDPVSRQAMSAFLHRLADGPGVGI